jgi:iron complex transport system substrate-binding protein
MKFKKMIVLFLVSVLCLMSVACSNEGMTASQNDNETGQDLIKITDCEGREVELEGQAKRVVDLTYLDGVRTLIELGAEDTLVGMSDMDLHAFEPEGEGKLKSCYRIVNQIAPELKDVKNVGSFKEPNAQLIMSLEPDVIFMQMGYSELADTLQKQTNIPVVCIGGTGILDFEVFKTVGKIVGKEERAEELTTYGEAKIKTITDVTDKISDDDKPNVFFWVRAFIGDPRTNGDYRPIELAGAKNVAADTVIKPQESFKITKEQISAWNPEIILKHQSMIETEGWHTIDSILEEPAIQGVKAIEDKKIYPIKGGMRGNDPATEVTEVFYLAKLLHPDEFADLDVEKEGNEILKKFYNKDGLYTDMVDFLDLCTWK